MSLLKSLGVPALLVASAGFAHAAALPDTQTLFNAMQAQAGSVQFQTQATGHLLLRAAGAKPLLADQASAEPLSRAHSFLNQFGAVFGLNDALAETTLQRISQDRAGNTHVHLDQIANGLPVFGARLVVHMNEVGIYGVSGVFLAGLASAPSNRLPAQELNRIALASVAKDQSEAELSIASSRAMYYRSGLLEGRDGQDYLAHEAMITSKAGDVRERVILDATSGRIVNRINEIHTVKNRAIYTPNGDTPAVITEGGLTAPSDPALTGDTTSSPASRIPRAPTDNLYIFAGGTYDLYANLFGHEGYDDGATKPEDQIQRSIYLVNDACPNAYWNGSSTNYCPGFDADDVVSHEWSHAYTEYTHGLIYQYQSGALNEAYSDIFGEAYDLVNGLEGPLGVTLTEGEYFENGGSRWVVGEDLSEPAAAILLRDMWDPDNFGLNASALGIQVLNFGYPGSVISSDNYYCGSSDGGGVHTNSGVPNHAFAMLVDGKSFNGVDIPAIGMTRAANIYFHAAKHYQVPSTNFAQHADALAQSCADLSGVALTDVHGEASPDVIDAATCAAVEAAMVAVEMRQNPKEKCGYQPLLQPEATTPPICSGGETPVTRFMQDWEVEQFPADWTVTANITGDTSEDVNWDVVDELPMGREGRAAFMPNTFGGSCAPGGDISASFQLDSPVITIEDADATLSISHLMQSEFAYDGGNIKYSVNGEAFAVIPPEAFRFNAYNTELETGAGAIPDPLGLYSGGNTNPMAGEHAFSGSDEGESSSDWGTSLIKLTALGVNAGDSLQIRFEFGQDGCNGNLGWFVDTVAIQSCAATSRNDSLIANTAQTSSNAVNTARGGALGGWLLTLSLLAVRRRRR